MFFLWFSNIFNFFPIDFSWFSGKWGSRDRSFWATKRSPAWASCSQAPASLPCSARHRRWVKPGNAGISWDFTRILLGFYSDFTRILLGFYRDRMGFHMNFMEIHQGLDCWENVRRTPHQSSDDEQMKGDSMGFDYKKWDFMGPFGT